MVQRKTKLNVEGASVTDVTDPQVVSLAMLLRVTEASEATR